MPRKPKTSSPLREIRSAIGLTQQQMAEKLGIFRGIVEKLENGTTKMTLEIALKYRLFTGCDLRRASDGLEVLGTLQGVVYSKEAFDAHQRALDGSDASKATAWALKAILDVTPESKLPEAIQQFEITALKAMHEHELKLELDDAPARIRDRLRAIYDGF